MSIDLSWIWDWLTGVVDAINSFFSSIWSQIQDITNTGQGLFAGLSALGSMLWDGIRSFADAFSNFAQQVYNFGEWIYKGFKEGLEYIFYALGNIGNAIYSGLQWLWNGIYWAVRQMVFFIAGAVNWLASTLGSISATFTSWIEGIRNSVNTWWTNLILAFRNKLKTTIMADLSITMTWKAFEKAFTEPSIKGFAVAVFSPVLAPIFGQTVASMVDALVPSPSTTTFELIPPITVPEITVPTLEVPTVPAPPAPTPVGVPSIGYGLPYDIPIEIKPEVEATTRSTDLEPTIDVSAEATVESTDLSATIDVSVETEVA